MAWLPPVDGPVTRSFAGGDDPFARGLRRAAVLAASPGEPVRAPCGGTVRYAGATPRGRAVTLGCGRRRVTLMPVRVAVRGGRRVERGAVVGFAAGDLRVSVREPDGAYVDPEPLFARDHGPAPPAGLRPRVRAAAPRPPAAPAPVPVPPIPWPAWAGVALLLAGSAVRGADRRRRTARRLEPSTARRAA